MNADNNDEDSTDEDRMSIGIFFVSILINTLVNSVVMLMLGNCSSILIGTVDTCLIQSPITCTSMRMILTVGLILLTNPTMSV